MTRSEPLALVPFRPAHLARLEPPLLSPRQAADLGVGWCAAGPAYSLLEGGRVLACAGLLLGRADDGARVAQAWALIAPAARGRPVALHRRVARGLPRLRARHGLARIEATALADFAGAGRWLERLGFSRRALLPGYLGTGETYARYELT